MKTNNKLIIILLLTLAFGLSAVYAPILYANPYKADEVLIKFKDTADPRAFKEVKENYNASPVKKYKINDAYLYRLPSNMSPAGAKKKIGKDADIEYIEPNYKLNLNKIPNDPQFVNQTGLAQIKAPEAWDITTGNPDTIIAVIDTGIDYTHEDLKDNIWTGPNGEHGYDYSNNDNDPMDDNGHGTHVAGIIGAVGNNNIGISGVCWQTKIMALKFTDSEGSGFVNNAIQAIQYAVNNEAKIINTSWSGPDYSQSLFEALQAVNEKDILIVTAAGNDSKNIDISPVYPACYNLPNIIVVGASDKNSQLASFSNFGTNSINITAPGVDILSTLPNNKYGVLTGTSASSSFISGICGLIKAKYPELTGMEIKTRLLGSSDISGTANIYNSLVFSEEQVREGAERQVVFVKGGNFYSDINAINRISQLVIKQGASSVSFYYMDDTIGTKTLIANELRGLGYNPATQTITITGAGAPEEDIKVHIASVPAVNAAANLVFQTWAGDTTAIISGSFTEPDPNTNDFYVKINAGAYGNATAGESNTSSPANQATAIGATLDGNDYISGVKIVHTDDFGNVGVNETTSLSDSLKYVKPYTPLAPTKDNITSTTVDVTVNPNLSEVSGLAYTIYEENQGKYVQTNGNLGTTPVWQELGTTAGKWGNTSGVTGKITVNKDSGLAWMGRGNIAGAMYWHVITSSYDGVKLAACAYNGYIATSTDSGATWTEQTSAGNRRWRGITSSSDGRKLAACAYDPSVGYIYTSTDGGATWTQRTSAGSRYWWKITSSSDGRKLAACVNGGYIYTSTDGGATWTERTSAGNRYWFGITSSADGVKLAASVNNGYIYTSTDSGVTWTEQTSAGSREWRGITSSSDGVKLAACVYGGYIYTSTDSGATWTQQTSAGWKAWWGITSSSDGVKLTASVYGGYISTSTDSGATWTEQTSIGSRNWFGITSSSDGVKLAACAYNGYISTSTDSGATWTQRTSAGSRKWWRIASSSDGVKLAAHTDAGADGVYIYTSTDSGATWTERTSIGSKRWGGITSSSDGVKLAAVAFYDYIYTSTDGGITWTQRTSAGSRNWQGVTSSSDGVKLAACAWGDYIYTSTDSGATWTQQTSAGSRSWRGIASSSDGTKLAACVYGGYIYTSTDSGATWTEQTSAGSRNWYGITSSSDGVKLAAGVDYGYIYTSTDGGAAWTQQTFTNKSWWGITSSSDGTKLAACVNGGYIYTSTDSGATWTEQTSTGNRNWHGITSSSDGTKLAACAWGDYIYTNYTIVDTNDYLFKVKSRNPSDASNNSTSESSLSGSSVMPNTAPVAGHSADNTILASQATNGTGIVTVTYKIKDAESNTCTLNSFEYNLNGAGWTATGTGLTGFTGNKTSAATFGAASEQSFMYQLPASTNGSMQIRFKANDGTTDSGYAASASFTADNVSPAVSSAANIASQPTAGSATVTISGSFTETNPNTNNFYAAINGGAYGSATAGTSNTASPANQATAVGATLDGNDYISGVKMIHTDDYGYTGTNETTSLAANLKYIKPYTPPAPTVNNPANNSVDVTVNKHASETDGLQYAIYESTQLKYVQPNGTLGIAAAWQALGTSSGQWGSASGVSGKITVTGLASPISQYSFSVKSRNTSDNLNNLSSESALSAAAGINNTSPVGGYSEDNIIPSGNCTQSSTGDGIVTIRFKVKDVEGNTCTLKTFQYSVDNGISWSAPANGDGSLCLNGFSTNKSSASSFAAAPLQTFTFNTKHADVSGMNNVNQSDVKIRFTVRDGLVDSVSPVTSEAFTVNNTYSTEYGFTIQQGAATSQKMITLLLNAVGCTKYIVFGDIENPDDPNNTDIGSWRTITNPVTVYLISGDGQKQVKVKFASNYGYIVPSTGYIMRSIQLQQGNDNSPSINLINVSAYSISSGSSAITWNTNVTGTYQVKKNATPDNPNSGTLVSGANAGGSCSPYANISSVVNYSDLTNYGTNIICIFVTSGGFVKTQTVSITKDSGGTGPITNAYLSAYPTSGTVPAVVNFMTNAIPTSSVKKFELDFNGDGRYDVILPNNKTQIQFTYHFPFTGQARLKATDGYGNVKTASVNMAITQSNVVPAITASARTTSSGSFSSSASGDAPLKVVFRPSGNFDTTNNIFSKYDCDFDGDGVIDYTTRKQGDIVYIYHEPGSYTAIIWGTNAGAFMGKAEIPITVNSVSGAPTAAISTNAVEGNIPFSITFTHGGSSDTGGSIAAYEWDFDGDGCFDWVSRPGLDTTSASYTYREVGVHTAKLRITDNDGLSDSETVTITAKSGAQSPPSISSLADNTNNMQVGVPIPVNLEITGSVSKVRLDFNADGGWDIEKTYGSSGDMLDHEYESAGYYKVIAQAEGTNGLTATTSFFILVTPSLSTNAPARAWLMQPFKQMPVYGGVANAKSPLVGDAFPLSRAASAEFQYKLSTASWDTITDSNKITASNTFPASRGPIFAIWNTSGLTIGNSYDVRLKVVTTNGNTIYSDDDEYGKVTITITNGATGSYQYTTSATNRPIMQQGFDFTQRKNVEMNDGTKVEMPPGLFGSTKTFKAEDMAASEIPSGYNISRIGARRMSFTEDGANQTKINKWVQVTIPYTDDNNDGFVDNTNIKVENLISYYYSTDNNWESVISRAVVDTGTKTVTFYTNHF